MKAPRLAPRPLLALLLSAVATAVLPGALAQPAADAGPLEPASPRAAQAVPPELLPFWLRGVDLDLPAQVAFAHWPPASLVERPYWLPWAPLSINRAAVLNQPIFLLLTVPWNRPAQRMMQGALSDPSVLKFLNGNYISIVVRPERRPDIHARYGSGTWPSIALLLPDGSPMVSQANPQHVALPITLGYADKPALMFELSEGRTYFDKWHNFLHGISQIYEKKTDVQQAKAGKVEPGTNDQLVRWLLGNYDAKNGGFGAAPKVYPAGFMALAFERDDINLPALDTPARTTLQKWVASPLHDIIEGGFHRLAAARDWNGIQYEKMLDVNVDLLDDLLEAIREQDDSTLRSAASDTARFLTTTLARPGGGFYNGQIADPLTKDGGGYWREADRGAAKAPPVDKLVLTGGNALAGAALLRASALLSDASLAEAGRKALDLVLDRALEPGRGVRHVIEPHPESDRFLASQADAALGLEDAYESTGDKRYLDAAKDIAGFVRNNLRVGTETDYRDHLAIGHEFGLLDMPYRPVQDNARFARVLVRLEAQGAIDDGRSEAQAIMGNYAGDLTLYGPRGIEAALAIHESLEAPLVVTIGGKPDDPASRALRKAALALPYGWTVIRSAPTDAPRAVLARRGKTRVVEDPAGMAAALKNLRLATAGGA